MTTLRNLITSLSQYSEVDIVSEGGVTSLERFLTNIPGYNDNITMDSILSSEDYQYLIGELVANLRAD